MRTWLSHAFCALSLALMLVGVLLAVLAPNGAPGVILCAVGLGMYGAWIEKHYVE